MKKHQLVQTSITTMQHMNFDTKLINYFPRETNKASNGFSKGGTLNLMYDQIPQGNGKLVGNSQSSSRNGDYEALDEMTMQLAKIKAKAFVDEMFIDENCSRRNGVSLEPTQFTDALEILKLKRSLFLQRIQLSQRDCKSLDLFLDARSEDVRGSVHSGTPDLSERVNEPRRKNKDHYPHSSKNYPVPRPQGSIVLLRPAPKVMDSPKHVICSCSSLMYHQRSKGKDRKVKNKHFSLKEIKKRLRRALRSNQEKLQMASAISSLKEPPIVNCINTGGGHKARDNSDTAIPSQSFDHANSRDKLYEREVSLVSKGNEKSPSNKIAIGKLKLSDDSHSKNQALDIFQEAKKHLSERLKNVDQSSDFENCRTPKTLRRVLHSPEHDFSVPLSLKRNIKNLSVMTESDPLSKLSVKIEQNPYDDDPIILDINDLEVQQNSPETSLKDLSNMRYIPDEENPWTSDRQKDFTLLATISSRNQEAGSLSSPSPSSSSMHSPVKVRSVEYGEEHQSPVSVLDPIFMEDTNTPKDSYSGQLRPLRIAFEDCDYMNEDEAISEYVRAVLQAAGFSWNNRFQCRPSQDEILDVSFPYGDILLQLETDDDPQLLVDFVNDVFLEVYQQHFACTPWASSYIKPNTRSVLLEQHFINQVAEDVKGAMFPEILHPTLDQLVGTDIAKSSSWLDIRVDVEELVNTIAEDMLEESIHGISIMFST